MRGAVCTDEIRDVAINGPASVTGSLRVRAHFAAAAAALLALHYRSLNFFSSRDAHLSFLSSRLPPKSTPCFLFQVCSFALPEDQPATPVQYSSHKNELPLLLNTSFRPLAFDLETIPFANGRLRVSRCSVLVF